MITRSKQVWQVGETVKVGFMSLRVTAREATPGDYKPDAYLLCGLGKNAGRQYRFVPHNGLERLADSPWGHAREEDRGIRMLIES